MRISADWKITRDRPINIAEGIAGPPSATVRVEDYEGFDLVASVVFTSGRYECDELCVRRRPNGPQVTGEAIRGIPVAGIIRDAVARMLLQVSADADGTATASSPLHLDIPSGLAAGGPTDEALRLVAKVYRVAQALGQPPTQSVQRDLELPRSTAGRWISLARKRGLLEPPPVKPYPKARDDADGPSVD